MSACRQRASTQWPSENGATRRPRQTVDSDRFVDLASLVDLAVTPRCDPTDGSSNEPSSARSAPAGTGRMDSAFSAGDVRPWSTDRAARTINLEGSNTWTVTTPPLASPSPT